LLRSRIDSGPSLHRSTQLRRWRRERSSWIALQLLAQSPDSPPCVPRRVGHASELCFSRPAPPLLLSSPFIVRTTLVHLSCTLFVRHESSLRPLRCPQRFFRLRRAGLGEDSYDISASLPLSLRYVRLFSRNEGGLYTQKSSAMTEGMTEEGSVVEAGLSTKRSKIVSSSSLAPLLLAPRCSLEAPCLLPHCYTLPPQHRLALASLLRRREDG
jgi:hypothetical protein